MRIDIITCLPRLLDSPFQQSIVKRSQEKGIVAAHIHDLRDFAFNKHQQVDDYAYGGGAGMVLMPEPLFACIEKLQQERNYDDIIFLTPDG
jgi:tRNA (guanine37-N1)-methyltransferase